MEGYGRFHPAQLFAGGERKRFLALKAEYQKLDAAYDAKQAEGGATFIKHRARFDAVSKRLADRFPDEEHWLLPTALGNTIRAFEVYPRVMYGLEAIQGWNRLLAVMSKEYRETVDSAKAQFDFWLNATVLALVVLVEFGMLAYYHWTAPSLWIPGLAVVAAFVGFWRAESAARGWGEYVKSAFDVYLPDLYAKLGLTPGQSRERIKRDLASFSQAVVYRMPHVLPTRQYAMAGDASSKASATAPLSMPATSRGILATLRRWLVR